MQIEAVVLQVIPFKEYDRILTLFSPQGILKLFSKGKKKDYLHTAALTAPLTHAEFQYSPGKKDLHRLLEGTILKQHLGLRNRYESLMAAEKIIQALLISQWPGKSAPQLFQLLSLFLEHLPNSQEPSAMSTIFLLKILKHEGMLQLSSKMCCRFAGECYEPKEAPRGALTFSQAEDEMLSQLALGRALASLLACTLPTEFQKKIETLFFQSFNTF